MVLLSRSCASNLQGDAMDSFLNFRSRIVSGISVSRFIMSMSIADFLRKCTHAKCVVRNAVWDPFATESLLGVYSPEITFSDNTFQKSTKPSRFVN